MKAAGKFPKNDDAVSPVIGVILMVAITVIMAAVIAALVFGVGSGVQKQYMVGAVISQISPSQIDVTYLGGGDADYVDFITVRVTTSDGVVINRYFNDKNSSNGIADIEPGTTSIVRSNNFTYVDHVTVIATFLDGSQQVIMERYV
ncbi:MAG: type IV pilin N-terminal domain-containing protein [ANME-2 cluster archaeon]|nr:type IV pilin N-terminal domain-containing protein [ANME-2 cluster archaeon]